MQGNEMAETVLSVKREFEGRVITVEQWQVRLPDGREAKREIVLHNGAAAVVPLDDRQRVTLVKQFRVALGKSTLEVPAGKLDSKDEDPFDCARRELEEETGLVAHKWQKLAQVVTTPGFCTERIALYLATELRQNRAHTDPDEFISLVKMPLSEAIMMVVNGEIEDAKTCLALLLAQQAVFQGAYMMQENSARHQLPGSHYPQAQG